MIMRDGIFAIQGLLANLKLGLLTTEQFGVSNVIVGCHYSSVGWAN